jgi:high-affinity nickel permease
MSHAFDADHIAAIDELMSLAYSWSASHAARVA